MLWIEEDYNELVRLKNEVKAKLEHRVEVLETLVKQLIANSRQISYRQGEDFGSIY